MGVPEEGFYQPRVKPKHRCPMTKDLLWVRKDLLAKILKHPCSLPFKHPVDAITEGIYPDYFMVVQHPMDLYTVKSRLDHGWYWSLDSCLADINLVWKNARLYNPADHLLHEWAVKLKEFTHKHIRRWRRNNNMEKRKRSSSQEEVEPASLEHSSQDINHPTDNIHVKTNFHDIRVCEELLNKIMRETGRQPLMSDGEEGSSPLHEGNTSPRVNEDLHVTSRSSPMRIEADAPSGSPGRSEATTRLDLETLERRLKTGHYHQAEQFANDFRRMISETYRNCSESDPLVEQAKELHHKFEYEYAHCLLTDDESMQDSEKEEEVLEGIMNNAMQIESQLNRLIQDEESRLKELKVDDLAVQRREEAKQLVLQISVMDSPRIAEVIHIMQMEDAGGEAMRLEGEEGEDEDTLTLDFEKMNQQTINHLKQYVNSVV